MLLLAAQTCTYAVSIIAPSSASKKSAQALHFSWPYVIAGDLLCDTDLKTLHFIEKSLGKRTLSVETANTLSLKTAAIPYILKG